MISDDEVPTMIRSSSRISRIRRRMFGNSLATLVIAKWQGELDDTRFQTADADPSAVNHPSPG